MFIQVDVLLVVFLYIQKTHIPLNCMDLIELKLKKNIKPLKSY